eukprot:CAMPEP_0177776746 /NCGR_PEP_ID=MMETSP0491_2-20121128/14890_1 /TAXON_ID=63592 /ORGANISM="Tetraselmis chuii, Strain PLY429" /LENGTH=428 /DNA_ID=CAMNT_0019295583 /DNA_START=282 /DNA_END=1568 /DNA_ORIENTATION=+
MAALLSLLLPALLCLTAVSPQLAGADECGKAPPLPPVDANGLERQMLDLSKLSDDPFPAVTRVLFTEHDMKARQFVKSLMAHIGLTVREDPMGNIFGRWEGSDPSAGAVLTGSHCDAIPLAGLYDGVLGVLGGIEALAALKRAGFKPRRSLEVMMFTSEEPTRFGLGCIGSRGMAGALTPETLAGITDINGTNFLEAANAAGYGGPDMATMLKGTRVAEGQVSHFVELHIEQGPNLENDGIDIGIVTAIAAPAALRVRFVGNGGHAGALLMPFRKDAGLAAAELALAVEKATLRTGAIDTVGTTGLFKIYPGAVNSVPRDAHLEIDVRDIDLERRDQVVQEIREAAEEISQRRGTTVEIELLNADPPATSGASILEAAEQSVKQMGVSYTKMVSRAYHDSLFMARIAPTAMIFIPCRGGVSHRPDEYS